MTATPTERLRRCCSGEAAKASTMLEPMLGEFREEADVTRRILERVPADKLTWKPHPKSMSLGQLALHIATVPGALATLAQGDGFDVSQANFQPPQPKRRAGNSVLLSRQSVATSRRS